MNFLPVGLHLRGRKVLLVGQGPEARQRAALAVRFGARLNWWRESPDPELESIVLTDGGQVVDAVEGKLPSLDDVRLVLVAGNTAADVPALLAAAEAAGIPVNIANGLGSSATIPALIDRDPLMIGLFSDGGAPSVTRWLRGRLEAAIPGGLGRVAEFVRQHRERVAKRISQSGARREFWNRLLASPVFERILNDETAAARRGFEQALDDAVQLDDSLGEVYLVGAGPGDPDLMTFRALRLLQQADVVLYDRLVAPAIVALARRDAEMVYVGKERDRHTLPQQEINDLLVHYARQGKRVCRLKGGDPFIFGRGGEELEKVAQAGIPFQVVPGVTAAAGCAAHSGIPLTHRDHAQSVRFVTGHRKDGSVDLPWENLAITGDTLVFYMGLVSLPEISRQLQKHGMAASTPAALVSRGTTPDQRVIVGDLASLPDLASQTEVKAPTLIIVGDVVSLHSLLNWDQAGAAEVSSDGDQ